MAQIEKKRFDVLDSFRGLAALCVALFHLKLSNPVTDSAFVNHSWLFVDFFFVLSGFVLSHTYFYKGGFGLGSFVKARIARLYPLHLYTLGVFLAFETAKFFLYDKGWVAFNNPPFEENNAAAFGQNIFLLQSLGVSDTLTWNTPSWSISAEFYSNIILAGLFALFALIGFRKKAFIGTALLLSVPAFFFLNDTLDVTYDRGWLRCFYGFALGMGAYALYAVMLPSPQKLSGLFLSVLEGLTIAACIGLVIFQQPAIQIFIPIVFAATVIVFAQEGGIISALLKKKIFLLSGAISYSLYLNHAIVAIILTKLGEHFLDLTVPGLSLTLTLIYLVTVWSYSLLTFRFIETPCRRRINKSTLLSQTVKKKHGFS